MTLYFISTWSQFLLVNYYLPCDICLLQVNSWYLYEFPRATTTNCHKFGDLTQMYSLTVLEAGSLKSSFLEGTPFRGTLRQNLLHAYLASSDWQLPYPVATSLQSTCPHITFFSPVFLCILRKLAFGFRVHMDQTRCSLHSKILNLITPAKTFFSK